MTGHRALEKKQITQGDNRKVQNPSESLKEGTQSSPFLFYNYPTPLSIKRLLPFAKKTDPCPCIDEPVKPKSRTKSKLSEHSSER